MLALLKLLSPAWRQEWLDTRRGENAAGDADWKVVVLTTLGVLLFLFIAVVGDLAKYAIPHGVHIPGMTSG